MTDARSRLCTASDLDALIEELAAELWESPRHGNLDGRPRAEARPMWQAGFRELAETAIQVLSGRHE